MQLHLVTMLVFALGTTAAAETVGNVDALLAEERASLAGLCGKIEFLDGFVTHHNIDGDGRDDAVVDYQRLKCDGSQSAFCGSGGCTMKLYLHRPDGSYADIAEFLAYGFEFDRPGDQPPTFVVAMHGNACDRVGVETCHMRYSIERDRVVATGEASDGGTNSEQGVKEDFGDVRWEFSEGDLGPLASISFKDSRGFDLDCRTGSETRMAFWADWMMEGQNGFSAKFLEEVGPDGNIWLELAVDGSPREFKFGTDEEQFVLASEFIPFNDVLIGMLMSGTELMIRPGNDTGREARFPLRGSSAALKSLITACR